MLPVWLTDTVTSDLDRALHYTLLWGLEGVVLRTVGTSEDRIPHVDEEKVIRRMRENELALAAVDPGLFGGPLGPAHQWMNEVLVAGEVFAFCERVDTDRVVVDAFLRANGPPPTEELAEPLREAGSEAEEHGVRLAVRNRASTSVRTGAELAELLEVVGRANVGAAWAPAAAREVGEAPLDGLEALEGRVEMVCLPDSVFEDDDPVEEILRRLREAGFDGPVCLEIESEPAPESGLRAATALVRMLRRVEDAADGKDR